MNNPYENRYNMNNDIFIYICNINNVNIKNIYYFLRQLSYNNFYINDNVPIDEKNFSLLLKKYNAQFRISTSIQDTILFCSTCKYIVIDDYHFGESIEKYLKNSQIFFLGKVNQKKNGLI